jgi:hypothetical protein
MARRGRWKQSQVLSRSGKSRNTITTVHTLFNPLPYDIFRGTQPMACGLFGPTEMTTLSELKTILMM